MEHNRDVKESPDRWHRRWMKAARPRGRFAVISSSVTAGALLVIGVAVAGQGSDNSTDLGSPARSVVSTTTTGVDGSPSANSSTTATSTTALGSVATTVSGNGTQGTLSTNTTTGGTPTTGGQSNTTTPTTIPSTTSPTTVADVTTTTTRNRAVNGSLLPSVSADANYSSDDPVLNLKIAAGDKDGYVSRVVVNWDDQSPWSVIDYPLSSCTEPLNSLVTPTAMHSYTEAGSYTVTITVSSVNCVGDGVQQSITTKQVSVGGSAPTTTTTAPPTADPQ